MIKMTDSNTTVLNLLGKEVSFVFSYLDYSLDLKGKVTDVLLNIGGKNQISLDYGDFYVFSELTEFKILDSDPVLDAFEALITDNKDFIDSLSKPTL
jgi:hypothetical protein